MVDEFDAFDDDFDVSDDDFETESSDIESFDDVKSTEDKSIKAIISKIVNSKYFKIGLIALIGLVVILSAVLIIGAVTKPSIREEEIETPFYQELSEYRFKLDETINNHIPYVLLKLELIYDKKYKSYSKTIEEASYQIEDKIVSLFINNMTFDKINNVDLRKEIYNNAKEYINTLLDKPIIKEILESRFEVVLMEKRY